MIKSSYYFLADLVNKRTVVFELAKRDFQQQYQGSYLGVLWAFLQPLLFISVLYMVFTIGFRVGPSGDMPFELYLISGMIAWLYFAENMSNSTSVIQAHSFLVKKVDFRLSILPIVKLLSSVIPHLFLISIAISFTWYQGYPPTLYTLQIIYYLMAMQLLLLGFGWLTSSTSVFVKDVSKVVAVITQFGFWLTPIFWNMSLIPERFHWIIKLNPAAYIVSGYRDSLVGQVGFWEKPDEALFFWITTFVFLLMGISVYRRLKPHFAEVI